MAIDGLSSVALITIQQIYISPVVIHNKLLRATSKLIKTAIKLMQWQ